MTMRTAIAAGRPERAEPAGGTAPCIPKGRRLRPELAAYFVSPEKPALVSKQAAIQGVLADLAFDRGCD